MYVKVFQFFYFEAENLETNNLKTLEKYQKMRIRSTKCNQAIQFYK